MKRRRLRILLVLWPIFLLAPGVLEISGLFGQFDMKSHISGAIVLLWVLGYLAQFGIFMWLMTMARQQTIASALVWWLTASLLPWAIDWTAPVSPLFLLLWGAVTVAVAIWIALSSGREALLQEHGIRAKGVVLAVKKPVWNVIINNVYIKRKVRLRIEREDGAPPYEGLLNGLFMLGEIPSPGDSIPLRVDPKNPQRFEDEKDSGGAQDSDWSGASSSGYSSSSYSSAPAGSFARERKAGGERNIADELEKLTRLRDRGALTPAQFEAAKRKLLGI
ncbi:MAG TPA: SHOCT domain-containing protein [Blastocatellia bacterium]|nr:SHOCT domain-containing protein [Blastocatellia bacterium]